MSKGINGFCCSCPNVDYSTRASDLYTLGLRVDAWRQFLNSETIKKLNQLRCHILWFNQYEYFDALICEFDCPEDKLKSQLLKLILPGQEVNISFQRNDIYDPRAWCKLPLNCFVPMEKVNPRYNQPVWNWEILDKNPVPEVSFGIKKPWVITKDCFTISHRIKRGHRFAEMTFSHPQLDDHFKNRRWVAEGAFPIECKRETMEAVLMAQVEDKCSKCMVTIVDSNKSHVL